jgi:hypothetical protein
LYRLLECLPIKSLREFMAAGDYIYKVRSIYMMI